MKIDNMEKHLESALTRIIERKPTLTKPIKKDTDITLSMVAKEANVNRTTLYHYPSIKTKIEVIKQGKAAEKYQQQQTVIKTLKQQVQRYLEEIREIKRQRDCALEENYKLSLALEKAQEQ